MKKCRLLFVFSLLLFQFELLAQTSTRIDCSVDPPPMQGTNLTQSNGSNLTICTNPSESQIMFDASAYTPPPGNNYVVWVRYTNGGGSGFDCDQVLNITGCTISTGGNGMFIIQLPADLLPPHILNDAFKIWVNFKHANAANWEYWYHRVNNTGIYVLPVTLVSNSFKTTVLNYYEGSTEYSEVKLNWQSASESNFSHYIIERYTSSGYMKIGQVNSQGDYNGNSYSILNYQFIDKYPIAGSNQYRLKMVDLDGNYKYSITIARPISGSVKAAPKVNCSNIYIQGQNEICGYASTFKLSSVPFYSTVSWTLSPSYLGQLVNTTYEKTTIEKQYSGSGTLQAVLSGCTDATKTKSVSLQMGQPAIYMSQDHTSYSSYSTTYWLSARNGNGVDLYCDWYEDNVYVGSGYSHYTTVSNYEPCKLYTARYNSTCGQSQASTFLCFQTPPPGGGCNPYQYYTVSPVPASDVMTISPNRIEPCYLEYSARSTEIYSVQIYDMYGNLKRERRNVNLKSPQQIDVRNLPTGNYVLHLIDDKNKRFTRQIRIEKR